MHEVLLYLGKYSEFLLSIIESIAIIIAAGVAIYSINTWRKEVIGKRRIELAEEVLDLFRQARDKINFMRSPLAFGEEGKSRIPEDDETEEQKKIRDSAYIPIERYNKNIELFAKLDSLKYRFQFYFGVDSVEYFNGIRKIIADIWSASEGYPYYHEKLVELNNKEDTNDSDIIKRKEEVKNEMKNCEHTFRKSRENDPNQPKLDEIVKNVDLICKSVFKK